MSIAEKRALVVPSALSRAKSREPRHLLFVPLVILGVVASCSAALAQNPYAEWKFGDINFEPPTPERFTLDNGLVVYFLPDSKLPVVTMTAIVRAGESFVDADQTGLGQITGEVIGTGGTTTLSPDEVDEQLEFLGIRWEGSVWTESAEFSMQCLSKDFRKALGLFSDMLLRPGFEQSRLQLAIDNAIEDVRRQNDSPGRIIRREFNRLVYGDHPYGRTPSEQSLGRITREGVEAFYRSYFHPNTTILAVSGDLKSSDLKAALKKAFGAWPQGQSGVTEIPDPPAITPGVYQIKKDITQTNIRFGHLGIERHNPDRHAVRVLNHILGGGGFTSRMMATVRSDSGWAYSVGTSFTTSDRPGLFYASCQTKTETTTKALALMKWVIADLQKNGIKEDELTTAKESIINSDVFNYDTPVEVVEGYARLEHYGFPQDQMKQDMAAVRAITKADVDAAAQKYLDPTKYVILAVGKVSKFDAGLSKFGKVTTISLGETP